MHFRLPKPLHGWREFAGEVAIIVLGVMIALGAEQMVETIHWRQQVAEARDALGYELADSVGQGYEREHIYDCVEQRLDLLAATIDQAGQSGRLPPLGSPESPPYRTWLNATWQTTAAGQTASHFPRRDLNIYGIIYVFIENLQQISPRELTVWSRLDSIAGPGRPVAPAEIQALRDDISEARLLNRLTTIASIRLRQAADSAHIHYDKTVVEGYSQRPKSAFPICTAMNSKPPAHYGGASLDHAVEHTQTQPLVIPQ